MKDILHDKIASAKTAALAKNAGRTLTPFNKFLWDNNSYNVMLLANLAKFTQNEEAAKTLKSTGNDYLIEHRPDPIWGDNMDGSGKNYQGKILEAVRDVI